MNIILSSLLMISALILIILSVAGFKQKALSGARAFSILMIAMVIHSVGYGFELLSSTQNEMYFWVCIEYMGAAFYPILILWFAREYVGERKFANRFVLVIVFAINVLTVIFVQTNQLHGWYYSEIGVDWSLGFPVLASKKGIWYGIQAATVYFAVGYALVVLFIRMVKTRGSSRRRVALVFTGMSIPLIASIVYLLGFGPCYIDLSAFSYLFMSIFAVSGLYRYDTLFLSEITHEMIFDTIEEGVIVVDREGFLLKLNHASNNLFSALGKLSIGDNVNRYPVLAHILMENSTQTVTIGEQHYQVQLIRIGKQRGTIVVFTDITEITNTKKQLEIFATTDQLTQLYNRRYFIECFDKLQNNGVLMLLDIDWFKKVNDQYGHPVGDQVLLELAQCLTEHFPDGVVSRYGGEEFTVLMEGAKVETIKKRADFFRESFANRKTEIPCTVSIGICYYEKGNFRKTMKLVDERLYQAKNASKNCVVSE